MTRASGWMRVSRSRPCPICGRPDWCLISADGTAVICPRTESPRRIGDAGYLHRLVDDARPRPLTSTRIIPTRPVPTDQFDALAAQYQRAVDPGRLVGHAASLGLSTRSLVALGIGWSADHGAWSYPMRDCTGRVVGIRLRRPSGRKYAVRGSREGLFGPATRPTDDTLYVVEGATDTAALIDLGVPSVVGRPSCSGGNRHVVALVCQRRLASVVVIADADPPGLRGADELARVLVAHVRDVRVITPPGGVKDIREWVRRRATHADLRALVDAAPVRRLTITSHRGHG